MVKHRHFTREIEKMCDECINIEVQWLLQILLFLGYHQRKCLTKATIAVLVDEESRENKRIYEIHVAVEIPDGSKLLFSCGLRIFLIKCRRFQGIQNT